MCICDYSRLGVPKFFRFISERYPLINTSFPAHPPQIDNLYLDMNGIIHNCVRSSPGNGASDTKRYATTPTAARHPRDIYLDVFKYIDNLVSLLTPQKLLYLAVDGVAPRAKMNQQRSRRFRSAKERADEHARRLREDPLYAAARVDPFDSNCITPGTPFMYNLTEALRYYVARKVTEDNAWSSIKVVLSGPNAHGEGEHKIMEYIRAVRESGQMSSDTRHCVYGLDADLIMLALVTHEAHFFIFREKVDFNAFWKRKSGPRVATALDLASFGEFELMSIGVLREYIAMELGSDGNSDLPFFNVERLMDDFVFILMLIGNDFLPNLPTLDIADGTLSVMLHLYKRILPLFGGYLTHEGTISPLRFEYFLSKLARLEEEILESRQEQSSSSGFRSRKRSARTLSLNPDELDDIFSLHLPKGDGPPPALSDDDLRVQIAESRAILAQNMSLASLKQKYYSSKFGKDFVRDGGINDLASSYVEGISWTLKYYTEGCHRWHWFYPFHYAPLASDISNVTEALSRCESHIESDKPFQPWQQLLAVLPPSSAWCLPRSFRPLMTLPTSPIRDYYPMDFETDLNGKRNDWEAVVLLPFVDEERLFAACDSVPNSEISEEERKCNMLGRATLFQYSKSHARTIASPFGHRLSAFTSKATAESLTLPQIPVGKAFSATVLPGTTLPPVSPELQDLPSLAEQDFDTNLQKVGVNVFGMPSKSDSLVLRMNFPESAPATPSEPGGTETNSLSSMDSKGISVGASVWFGFPWRRAGFVTAIADSTITRAQIVASQSHSSHSYVPAYRVEARPTVASDFERNSSILTSMLLQKQAISIEKPSQIVTIHVDERCISNTEDQDEPNLILQLPQFIQPRVPIVSSGSRKPGNSSAEAMTKGQVVMYIGHGAYFGHKCSVVSTAGGGTQTRIRFNRAVGAAREPPFAYRVVSYLGTQKWYTLSRLAQEVGLSPYIVDMFLGSFRVRITDREEVDIGLGVKYIARGLHIPGYARRDDRMHFVYSDRCANLIKKYRSSFPFLFENVERMKRGEGRTGSRGKTGTVVEASELLKIGRRVGDALNAVAAWLSVQEIAEQPLVSTSAEVLPKDIVIELERHCKISTALQAEYEATLHGGDAVKVTKDVPRSMIVTGCEGIDWNWNNGDSNSAPPFHEPVPINGSGIRLGDRVVNRLGSGTVPFALRGTVVGIHPPEMSLNGKSVSSDPKSGLSSFVEVVFDEAFIGGGSLGGRCSEGVGKAVPAYSLYIIRPERDNSYYSKHYMRASRNVSRSSDQAKGVEVEQKRKDAIGEAAVQKFDSVTTPQSDNKTESSAGPEQDSTDERGKGSDSDRSSDKTAGSWDRAESSERSKHSAETDEEDHGESGDQVVMEVLPDGSVTRIEKGPDGVERSVAVGSDFGARCEKGNSAMRHKGSYKPSNHNSPHRMPRTIGTDNSTRKIDADKACTGSVLVKGTRAYHQSSSHDAGDRNSRDTKERLEKSATCGKKVPCASDIPVPSWSSGDKLRSLCGVPTENNEKAPSDADNAGKSITSGISRKGHSGRAAGSDKDERERFAKFVAEEVKKHMNLNNEQVTVPGETLIDSSPGKDKKGREGRRGRGWRDESVTAKDEDEDVALWRRLQEEARGKEGDLHGKLVL